MATNVKAKKKKGTYDNPKLLIYVTVGLAVVIALITFLSIFIYTSGNYVGKVSGKKIYDYEYEYYLYMELSKMQSEIDVTGLSDDEETEKYKEFWNTADENGEYPEDKAKQNALEEARKFKASYLLAVKEGYKLSKKEQSEIKNTVDYYISMYMNYGTTRENAIKQICGTMTLNQYKGYMIQSSAIENYKTKVIKPAHEKDITDEVVKTIYDEDRDKYRYVDVRLLFLKSVNEQGEELGEEEYADLLEKANEIAASFNETGKYEDKDFVEYIKAESDDTSTTDGLATINKDESPYKSEKVNEYAYKLEQDDLGEDGFTEYTVIEDKDTDGIYIVRGEKIVDIDTPKPEETEETEETATEKSGEDIKAKIRTTRLEEIAVEELGKAVSGEKYKVKNVKNKTMQKYVDEWDLRNQ